MRAGHSRTRSGDVADAGQECGGSGEHDAARDRPLHADAAEFFLHHAEQLAGARDSRIWLMNWREASRGAASFKERPAGSGTSTVLLAGIPDENAPPNSCFTMVADS